MVVVSVLERLTIAIRFLRKLGAYIEDPARQDKRDISSGTHQVADELLVADCIVADLAYWISFVEVLISSGVCTKLS
jgi:hypothetical protein